MPITFTHPHVHAEIVDEEVVFLTGTGLTNLYAAFGAQRGPEELRYITTPEEFTHVYGEPDFDTYGQQPLQVINWTREEGGAWCRRVCNPTVTDSGGLVTTMGAKFAGVALLTSTVTQPTIDLVSSNGDATPTYYVTWWQNLHDLGTADTAPSGVVLDAESKIKTAAGTTGAFSAPTNLPDNLDVFLNDNQPYPSNTVKPTATNTGVLAVVYPTGRGKWYNNLKFRLTYEDHFEDTYDFAVYRMEIYEERAGSDIELEQFYVSFKKSAKGSDRQSMYITDVLERNSEWLRAVVNHPMFEAGPVGGRGGVTLTDKWKLTDPYDIDIFDQGKLWDSLFAGVYREVNPGATDAAVATARAVTPTRISFTSIGSDSVNTKANIITDEDANSATENQVFLVTVASTGTNGVIVANLADSGTETPTSTTTPLAGSALNQLKGGTDGDGSTTDLGVAQTELIKAWNGGLDPRISDNKDLEVDIMLDAKYPADVQKAMVTLARKREDCIVMRDLGFRPAVGDNSSTPGSNNAVGARKAEDANDNTVHVAYWSQDFRVYDPYSGKNVRVTTPYLLSTKIPRNDRLNGFYRNFVGPRRGGVTGVVPGTFSWFPTENQRETLYKQQINYIQRDPNQTYLGSQSTSQRLITPMSDISIARIAWRIQREAQRIADNYRFEWFDPGTFTGLQNNLQGALDEYVGSGMDSVTVSVTATPYERARKIARVQIRGVFTQIIERIAISIIVERN